MLGASCRQLLQQLLLKGQTMSRCEGCELLMRCRIALLIITKAGSMPDVGRHICLFCTTVRCRQFLQHTSLSGDRMLCVLC